MAYLEREHVQLLRNWPPYSPDLSPIENLWHQLEQKRSERYGHTASESELKSQLNTVWAGIPQRVVNQFVTSFPAKVARCRSAGGM